MGRTPNIYLNDTDLTYEIIISKGKGYLTKSAEKKLILLANRLIMRFGIQNEYDRNDILNSGIFQMFYNWYNFDEEKYQKSFPYYTELCKRGFAAGFNELQNSKNGKMKFINVSASDIYNL